MAAKKNEQHPLRIEGYGSAGEGGARLEGQAVFVKGALAGEICQVQLLKVGKSAAWGRVTQVLTPVPGRQSPDCPRYPRCGGCQLRHMTYAEELRFKRQKVQDALQRIGGWTGRVEKIHGAEAPDRYRNKIQFPVADGPRVGFFRARSHEVIDAEDCLLQPLAATRLREAFKLWMERYQVPAYDERVHGGLIRHFYVRVNQRGQSLCAVIANGTDLPHQEELVQALRRGTPLTPEQKESIAPERSHIITVYRELQARRWHAEDLQPLFAKLGEENTGRTLVAVAALEQVGLITAADRAGAKFWELVPATGKKNLADAPILKCLEER